MRFVREPRIAQWRGSDAGGKRGGFFPALREARPRAARCPTMPPRNRPGSCRPPNRRRSVSGVSWRSSGRPCVTGLSIAYAGTWREGKESSPCASRLLRRAKHRLDEARYGVLPGLDGRLQPKSFKRLARLRADRGEPRLRELFQQARKIEPGVEVLHCRTAGEGNPIRAVLDQPGRCASEVLRLGNGLVKGDVVHNGAELLECLAQFWIRDLRARQEDADVLDALDGPDRGGDFARKVLLGHRVDTQMQLLELRGRRRSDGGEAQIAQRAHVLE